MISAFQDRGGWLEFWRRVRIQAHLLLLASRDEKEQHETWPWNSDKRCIVSIATRTLMFLKAATARVAYAIAGFLLVRPFLLRNGLIRKFLFNTIHQTTNTFVYSKVGAEHYLVNSSDMGIGKLLFAFGEFDFRKFTTAIDLCNKNLNGRKKPTILIDAGANIGPICIPAVNRGFMQRAVAIEPEPLNCRVLRANIALNGLSSSILVHECGLAASKDVELKLELSENLFGDHRIQINTDDGAQRNNIVKVKSEILDGLCPATEYADSLLWMDIEGYEGFALLGGHELLKLRIPLVVEFWPYGMNRASSFGALKSAVAHYNGYFDLANPNKINSIDSLDNLYQALGDGFFSLTDILLI